MTRWNMSAGSPRSSPSEADPDLDFVIVIRTGADQVALACEARLRSALATGAAGGLALAIDRDDCLVWAMPGRVPVAQTDDGRLIILGAVIDHQGTAFAIERLAALTGVRTVRPGTAAAALVERGWGQYLGLFADPANGRIASVMRDPLGAFCAYAVRHAGIIVLARSWPAWLVAAIGTDLAPDERIVANILANPVVPTFASALAGAELLAPGYLHDLHRPDTSTQIWSPLRFAAGATSRPPDIAQAQLRGAVDMACRGMAADHERMLLQLSGGLDSAIILAGLSRAISPDRMSALNLATAQRATDESRFANDAARAHGVSLVARYLDPAGVDLASLAPHSGRAAPRIYGLDVQQETVITEAARSEGASAIMTGQGGDAVFFQMAHPELAVDYRRAHGIAAYGAGYPWIVARRANCSVWRIWGAMLRDQVRWGHPSPSPVRYDARLLGRRGRDMLNPLLGRHPWLRDAHGLPPAKRLHLTAISHALVYLSATARQRTATICHPLLSQPVVEACLAVPTFDLSADLRDRSLARDAFRDVVPASILARTTKGESSYYTNRAVVANLGFLRDHLLGGELARRGLVDVDALDALLDEHALMNMPYARTLIFYAGVEAWLRRWC